AKINLYYNNTLISLECLKQTVQNQLGGRGFTLDRFQRDLILLLFFIEKAMLMGFIGAYQQNLDLKRIFN
ncbi:MAG: hypothetical protein PVG39_03785, partial [Desulfobacteraceae bacterium]